MSRTLKPKQRALRGMLSCGGVQRQAPAFRHGVIDVIGYLTRQREGTLEALVSVIVTSTGRGQAQGPRVRSPAPLVPTNFGCQGRVSPPGRASFLLESFVGTR